MQLHILFTRSDVWLSKRDYPSWRDVQEEVEHYVASLDPWEAESVIEYLEFDYPQLSPSADTQVRALLSSADDTVVLTFEDSRA